ncbi:hypothetical protein [Cytobacillus sp. IB215665]|uniref:hypothetical protein n=1 Tax=Cytobacillus sp. IB215665 TaxID=3097357 RepID=UPI002A0CC979|nr:hypothetical protein [Cytobacillus sp. IB215665]MDX8364237.1 hypothetical protein [Cytobacillus sp. IB215665]
MNRRSFFIILALFSIFTAILFVFVQHDSTQESIIYFPIDPDVTFTHTDSTLTLLDKPKNNKYIIEWDVTSILDREAYLRQDISLLYANGRLLDTLSEWEDYSEKIAQYKKIQADESRYFVTISYHHAELHNDDLNIKSSQQMSFDELYVINSLFAPLQSFRIAENKEQKEWKYVLDHAVKQQLQYSWKRLVDHFQLPLKKYIQIPLSDIVLYNDKPLINNNAEKSQQILGNLWEGLYKNYFLGIKKKDGTIIEPVGSTIPLILLSKDYTHLIILIETRDGEAIKLIQQIPSNS